MTNEERKERQKRTCKHFNGLQNSCCKAGVAYDEVKSYGKGIRLMLPCLPYHPFKTADDYVPAFCDKREVYTDEELEEQDRQDTLMMERCRKAIASIQADAGQYRKGETKQGMIVCPNCNGKLHYSRSVYNGHIHAQCETKDCVWFMQ